jgi:hypothetical protein
MKYALVVYETENDMKLRPETMPAWNAYAKALVDAGVLVGGAGLEPPTTATTVRFRNGQRQIQDGPFADTKEQLGGFFLIDVPTLDKAIEWASRAPCTATGCIEIRPQMPPANG